MRFQDGGIIGKFLNQQEREMTSASISTYPTHVMDPRLEEREAGAEHSKE